MTDSAAEHSPDVPLKRIAATWWPLAASWLLMSLEGPALSAFVARLADPEIHLAAYGSVVFPLALIIESPIIMLLAASTALSKDWDSFVKVRRFMMRASAALTALHALVAFTPLYYTVVRGLIGAPEEVIQPARLGLCIMLPWTWSIAYRRFHQGVLIRFGWSRSVSVGTLVRLLADLAVLACGYAIGTLPGTVVATGAVATGVMSEATFIGLRARSVVNGALRRSPPVEPPLTWREFFAFYVPLAMTSLLSLLMQPIGAAGLSRMPNALSSLAAWPVVSGLVFMLRSAGMAYTEVVVALLNERGAWRNLRRFAILLATSLSGLLLLLAATPLADFWFRTVSGLNPMLADLARRAIWYALPIPALTAVYSWYQGVLVYSRHTRGITEAVVIFLAITGGLMAAGVAWGGATGIYVAWVALAIGTLAQTVWLGIQTRPTLLAMRAGDS